MIPSLIAFLVHLTVVYVFAQAEAWSDHMLIKNGYSIDHVRAWFIRAGVIALSMVILVPFFGPFEGNDLMGFNLWTVLGFCLMSAFGFSAVFRYQLNKIRGLDALYVAPWSNWYDMAMWMATNFFVLHPWNWEDLRERYFDGEKQWVKSIHRAGRLAYIVEATLFTLGLAMALSQII